MLTPEQRRMAMLVTIDKWTAEDILHEIGRDHMLGESDRPLTEYDDDELLEVAEVEVEELNRRLVQEQKEERSAAGMSEEDSKELDELIEELNACAE